MRENRNQAIWLIIIIIILTIMVYFTFSRPIQQYNNKVDTFCQEKGMVHIGDSVSGRYCFDDKNNLMYKIIEDTKGNFYMSKEQINLEE